MLRHAIHVGVALALGLAGPLASPSQAAPSRGPGVRPDPHGFRAEMVRMREDGKVTRAEVRSVLRRAALELAGVDDVPDDLAGYGYVVPAGDLDGDGLEDAIEDHWEEGVSAVRGTDGETLWAHDFGYQGAGSGYSFGFAIPAGDLDGQGADDLIEVMVEETDLIATYPWKVTYRGVRGSDGATLWTRPYDNPWLFADAFVAYAYADVGFPLPMGLAEDADGDGATDLLHARFDFLEVDAFVAYEWRERSTFELVSGRTGEVISSFTLGPTTGSTDAVVIPDVTGDGRSDVLSLVSDWEAPSSTIAARGGQTGTSLWERTRSSELGYARGLDLDGGTGEVLLETFDEETETTGYELLEGATGDPRWTSTVPGYGWAFPAGDASEDGTQDLLVISDVYDEEADEFSGQVRLASGSDGGALWTLDAGIDAFAWPAGDATADGVTDAIVQRIVYDWDTDEITAGPGSLVSGVDGQVAWSQADGSEAPLEGLGADLDGDGSDDVLALDDVWEVGSYQALSGRDGEPLWASPAAARGAWLIIPADLSSAPGADLLESAYDEAADADLTGARSGADATLHWQRRFEY